MPTQPVEFDEYDPITPDDVPDFDADEDHTEAQDLA